MGRKWDAGYSQRRYVLPRRFCIWRGWAESATGCRSVRCDAKGKCIDASGSEEKERVAEDRLIKADDGRIAP